ncbi:hypothetical protein DI44_01790 [Geobacillus sp. CAMR5420]|nr:hypothetical protein DI44_01790 [Geobacillus sp. CAMR5420]
MISAFLKAPLVDDGAIFSFLYTYHTTTATVVNLFFADVAPHVSTLLGKESPTSKRREGEGGIALFYFLYEKRFVFQ